MARKITGKPSLRALQKAQGSLTELKLLIIAGNTIKASCASLGISMAVLYYSEVNKPSLRKELDDAIRFSLRGKIDDTVDEARNAKTKDEALACAKRMEVLSRAAELLHPGTYGKGALNVNLPQGDAGTRMVISWQAPDKPMQDVSPRVIEHKAA